MMTMMMMMIARHIVKDLPTNTRIVKMTTMMNMSTGRKKEAIRIQTRDLGTLNLGQAQDQEMMNMRKDRKRDHSDQVPRTTATLATTMMKKKERKFPNKTIL